MTQEKASVMVLVLWCSNVVRDHHNWRANYAAHCVTTTFEECPEEEELPCPVKGCGGVCRTRPLEDNPKPKKKKVRKKRAPRKA